jgi:hypothetical protein
VVDRYCMHLRNGEFVNHFLLYCEPFGLPFLVFLNCLGLCLDV